MKLNKKGFAITTVLYGLLILFVLLVSSYLLILNARKNRIDNIVSDLENDYFEISDGENGTTSDPTPVTPVESSHTIKITVYGKSPRTYKVNDGQNYTIPLMDGDLVSGIDYILSCENGIDATFDGTKIYFKNVTSDITCTINPD